MSAILYTYGNSLYINMTNQCPCDCVFCVRKQQESVGSADSLWLEQDPTADEVIAELGKWELQDFSEVIFCGYGEPFCALDKMLEICRWLRGIAGIGGGIRIRANTNGLADLINKKHVAPLLDGYLDAVSISMNASNAQKYNEICRPSFGIESFSAMLQFAQDCKQYVPDVKFSIVDVLPPEDIEICQKIAGDLGVPLRIRRNLVSTD